MTVLPSSGLSQLEQRILDEFSKPISKGVGELAVDLGLKDNTTLLYHIKKLMRAGFLIRPKKGTYKTVLSYNLSNSNIIEIPYYGEAKCGDNGMMLQDYPEYMIPLNIQVLRRNSRDLFALKAVGDSMNPQIQEGDTVIAHKHDQGDISTRDYYVVAHQNQILIKKIAFPEALQKKRSKRKVKIGEELGFGGFLMSVNPEHLPIPIIVDEFRVVGKVVGVFKNF
jgi:SOS-response transcriptional repressor LexA